jgi:hypothetical protein
MMDYTSNRAWFLDYYELTMAHSSRMVNACKTILHWIGKKQVIVALPIWQCFTRRTSA